MKAEILNEVLEYRDGEILGVEDYNGTLDRCDYGYIITVRYRQKSSVYPTVDMITVYTIYSETIIYDFKYIFEYIHMPTVTGYEVLNWEMKGIGAA